MAKIKDNWLEILNAPIPTEELEWKQKTSKEGKKGWYLLFICYFTARLATSRLNEAFGRHWSEDYEFGSFTHDFERIPNNGVHKGQPTKEVNCCKCTITIQDEEGTFTRKGYANSADIEPAKSAESNALKRAVGKFGTGSELYDYPKVYVEGRPSGNKAYPPSKKVMQKAIDHIVKLVKEGDYEEAYFIDQQGGLHTFAFGWKDKKVNMGSSKKTSNSSIPAAAKTKPVKDTNVPKKEEPKAPDLKKWPPYSEKENSTWAKAIAAWDGNIKTSKSGKHIVTVPFKGKDVFYELGKAQHNLLVVHEKHGLWTSQQQVNKSKDGKGN